MSGGRCYYVDGEHGCDTNSGGNEAESWQSLERLNHASLRPGDRIWLTSGQRFHGTLRLTSQHGERGRPIRLTTNGLEPAVIDAGDEAGLIVEDCSHFQLSNLCILGSGRKDGNHADGLQLLNTHDVVVEYVEVAGFRGSGIRTYADRNTCIAHAYAHDNGFAGIAVGSGQQASTHNLYVGYCVAENNAGDPSVTDNHSGNGIVVSGVQTGVIEYCEAMRNGWDMPREGNGPVGIWGWNSVDLVIQYCVSHHNLSPGMDGGGFDFDGGVTQSVMQYNFSHHNAGAGYGLYQFAGASPWQHNTVRYNTSFDDGHKNAHSGIHVWSAGEGMSDAEVHGNLVINPCGHAVSYLHDVPGLRFWSNRFITGAAPTEGQHTQSAYVGNAYFSVDRALGDKENA